MVKWFDANTVTALATVIAAITAVAAIIAESRRSRFVSGVDLIHRLNREFHSDQYLRIRSAAARGLEQTPISNTNAVDEILSFFEEVSFFVRRGVLDPETTWYFFFSYMFRFQTVAEGYIASERREGATLRYNYTVVYPTLLRIEQRDRARLGLRSKLSEAAVRSFLVSEQALATHLSGQVDATLPSNMALEPASRRRWTYCGAT